MKKNLLGRNFSHVVLYLIMLLFVLVALYPFLWLLTTSTKTYSEAITWPPTMFGANPSFDNYVKVFHISGFVRSILNSVIYSVVGAFLTILLSTMAAYGFSRYRFKGRKVLFFIVLATLMVPSQVTLIPIFLTLSQLDWINTFQGLIVPGIGSAFAIYLVNQFGIGIPEEYFDSGKIDGANAVLLYGKIFVPLCKPVIATLVVLEFINRWNDLFWPLIVTNTEDMTPLTLLLTTASRYFRDIYWNELAASMTIAILPILLLYIIFQKYFVEGISLSSGVKG